MPQLKRVDHIGIVVDSYDRTHRLLTALGLSHQPERTYADANLKAGFYQCGDVSLEVIECYEPGERARRLGDAQARLEHIGVEVDDLRQAIASGADLGIAVEPRGIMRGYQSSVCFTEPRTSGGVQFQLIEKDA